MTTIRRHALIPVERLEDIPTFDSEAEEVEFWSTHRSGNRLLEEMTPSPAEMAAWLPPPRSRKTAGDDAKHGEAHSTHGKL